ncbi:MAG: STAS domain-containing protein [Methanomicrobium sp.]|nr:STAS domain-containing protein [Methanomicrobium sp.]
MEITTLREDNILIFALSGRLDAKGAEILESEIKKSLHADDKSVVVDMKNVSYLSSGGIRVLIYLKKTMKKCEGTLILSSVQDYPSKVLDMAGLLDFFKPENSREDAIIKAKRGVESISLIGEIKNPSTVKRGVRYSFESGTSQKGIVKIKGDVRKLLNSELEENDIFEERFDDSYSVGLGSMGSNKKDAMNRLGDMINIKNTFVWFPTDGSDTPDFFTPVKAKGDVVYYSGLNIKSGPFFNDIISMESDEAISFEDLYNDIFSFAYDRQRNCKGLIFVVIWGVTGEFFGSRVIKSPISENKPFAGGIITDPDNYSDWFSVNENPQYLNETIFSAGLIADNSNPSLKYFSESDLKSVFYYHPADNTSGRISSQSHCAVVRNIPWDKNIDISKISAQLGESGEIVDIRHVLMKTTLKKAKIGISYIEKIESSDFI